jgi:hypothetical protein
MINYGLCNIPGLVSAFDVGNPRSYSGSGGTWYDLCNTSATSPGDPYWANNIDSITISLVLQKISTVAGYAEHPVSKWNQSYNDNASFILYHFGGDNSVGWYGNVNQDLSSGWTNLTQGVALSNGTYNHIVLQYSCFNGGQMWANGNKIGGRTAGGMLGQTRLNGNTSTSGIGIIGPLASSHSRVHHIQFYNKELEDSEITMLYNSHKNRFAGMP